MNAAEVLEKIKEYQKKIHDTDIKVRQYLSDRSRYPHPLHEELVIEVRNYERLVERRLRAFRNAEVEMRLDNLLYSLMVHERAWKKHFQDAAHVDPGVLRAEKTRPPSEANADRIESKPAETQMIFEKIYEISKQKWNQYGIEAGESKEEMARRLMPQYQQIRDELKEGKKLRVLYDKTSHRIRLKAVEV